MTRATDPRPALVVGIYRRRHAEAFAKRLRRGAPREWPVALWALDEPHRALDAVTVGSGPGQKFDLVNEILARHPRPERHHVLVVDDDILFGPDALLRLVRIGERAEFDLWQAAHARGSHLSHEITRRRLAATARETTFVEIGPVFVVAAQAAGSFLPFPGGMGMGWGLEVVWRRARDHGRRLGIVDAVTIHHPDVPNTTYPQRIEAEERRLRALLADADLADLEDAQETLGTWPLWRRRPPWLSG